jgi:D-inositol-3-phosphate glycosyltransferase
MEAFALFAQGKPENVKYHSHCGVKDSAVDTMKLATRFGIGKRMMVTNLLTGAQQVPAEKLNRIYNATDVGINSGLGEGFGLPNIEHAVTGAPQVVADHSALHELYYDCGVLIGISERWLLPDIMTVGGLIRPEDMALGLDAVYQDKELYTILSDKSIEKFSKPEYSWKNISKQWDNLFDEVLDNAT